MQYLCLLLLFFGERSLSPPATAQVTAPAAPGSAAPRPVAFPPGFLKPSDSLASDALSDHTSWRARDEAAGTYWATSETDAAQWIRFDLDAPARVNALAVLWLNGAAQTYQFTIAVSGDASTWKTVASGRSTRSAGPDIYTFPEQLTRYVRVTIAPDSGAPAFGVAEAAVRVPSAAQAVTAPGSLTPESFGARGDGVTDDTTALTALFNAANKQAKPIAFAAGKTYLTGRSRVYQYSVTTNGLTVQGNGATIKVMDGTTTASSLYVLRIAAQNVTVENLTVDANRAGRPALTNWNQYAWFIDGGSVNVRLKGIRGLNSPVDNLYIRDQVGRNSDALYPREIYIDGAEMLNAARNNASVISSKNVYITGGRFNGANGSNPEAGIDIEPNTSDTYGNNGVYLTNVETSNNRGGGVDVAGHHNQNIVVKNHVANSNGTAFFAMPDGGAIQVDGLTGRDYKFNPVASGRNGFISLVPGGRSGARVTLQNVTLTGIDSTLPGVHQNYDGAVTIHDTQINQYTGTRPVVEARPADIYNIYRDGVKIR
ncbi:galactose-binding domain-containing protein [Deinococcus radiotolerans]|uniref:galactose-binding domain-containing protein n=1 Tax=Deinococcus radiotolerans TaxID=1309407 RepID=UPI0016656AFC|nr:discoidin domain-containing protein [Deinococcus radiotolerans]